MLILMRENTMRVRLLHVNFDRRIVSSLVNKYAIIIQYLYSAISIAIFNSALQFIYNN